MKLKTLIIFLFFFGGCTTTSKLNTESNVVENNKDVFILSTLIRDHLRSNGRDLNLYELVLNDTLRRISNNFEKIELKIHGGYISVHYKFSDIRDVKKIELNELERQTISKLKWIIKDFKDQYDGEIQFDFGERLYRIRKIIIREESKAERSM